MTPSELIQQQRHILHTLHDAVWQYREQIAQAKERLERTLEQIQAEKAAAEEQVKQEYEQVRDKHITAVLDKCLPAVTGEKQAAREAERAKLRATLLSIEPSHIAVKINDFGSLKSEMEKIKISYSKATSWSREKVEWIMVGILLPFICITSFIFLLISQDPSQTLFIVSVIAIIVMIFDLWFFFKI